MQSLRHGTNEISIVIANCQLTIWYEPFGVLLTMGLRGPIGSLYENAMPLLPDSVFRPSALFTVFADLRFCGWRLDHPDRRIEDASRRSGPAAAPPTRANVVHRNFLGKLPNPTEHSVNSDHRHPDFGRVVSTVVPPDGQPPVMGEMVAGIVSVHQCWASSSSDGVPLLLFT